MARSRLRLSTVGQLRGGRVGLDYDSRLASLVKDVRERYGVNKKRTIELVLELTPGDQVVLDAAAGDRAHEDAVVAHREQRPRRARARAEGPRHRHEPGAASRTLPREHVFEDVEVEALHGGDYTPRAPQLGPVASRVRAPWWKSSRSAARYWSAATAERLWWLPPSTRMNRFGPAAAA